MITPLGTHCLDLSHFTLGSVNTSQSEVLTSCEHGVHTMRHDVLSCARAFHLHVWSDTVAINPPPAVWAFRLQHLKCFLLMFLSVFTLLAALAAELALFAGELVSHDDSFLSEPACYNERSGSPRVVAWWLCRKQEHQATAYAAVLSDFFAFFSIRLFTWTLIPVTFRN